MMIYFRCYTMAWRTHEEVGDVRNQQRLFLQKYCILFPSDAKERQLIQGDSRGKVNILGCDKIGHCEKISAYEHVSKSEWLPTQHCLNPQTQKHCGC